MKIAILLIFATVSISSLAMQEIEKDPLRKNRSCGVYLRLVYSKSCSKISAACKTILDFACDYPEITVPVVGLALETTIVMAMAKDPAAICLKKIAGFSREKLAECIESLPSPRITQWPIPTSLRLGGSFYSLLLTIKKLLLLNEREAAFAAAHRGV